MIVETPQVHAIAFPRFSPDGAWIAFTATSDPSVGLAPTPGLLSGRATLLHTVQHRNFPGITAAYAHGAPWDVWVVRPDGSDLRRITAFADDDSSAAWSPDGCWLVTFSAEALHVVAVDGSANYCITNQGGYGALEWLP